MKYFPYLRGKQFELIALRDICSIAENPDLISPIIEPVKPINATLTKTIECLCKHSFNFNLILNPQEGEIETDGYENLVRYAATLYRDYPNFQPSFLINERVKIRQILSFIKEYDLQNLTLICTQQPNNEDDFKTLLSATSIRFVVLEDDSSVRRLSRKIRPYCRHLVSLADRFNLKPKNADYAISKDELFSEDHMYFEEEGFVGYGDYLTIGNNYSDGGFLPYAVAIHLTYPDRNDTFRVHHFISDSNDDNADVPNKVSEALSKLVPFIDELKIHTNACEQFRKIYKDELYPGLGSIKKLSILNHLELVYSFFRAKTK